MIKKVIEISEHPAHLSVRMDQLHIRRHTGSDDPPGDVSVPCEDVGVVVIDHMQTTYTLQALGKLVEAGAAVVLCGRNHMPAGMLLPFSEHTQVVWRLHDQVAATKPLKKNLWKQIVVAKIRAQARNLPADAPARRKLLALARQVRSGDPTNVEAQAARVYWHHWLGPDVRFRRRAEDAGVNAFLNYGYAVVRAAVARALVSAGLFPALGIHHANRANAFCLADDLVEPLRPLVDARARRLFHNGQTDLGRPAKAELLGVLHQTVRVTDQTGPLLVALHRMGASLARCLRRQDKKLLIPVAVDQGA